MAVAKKVTGKAMSMPGGLALGGGISLLVTVLCSAVLAKLLESEKIPENGIGYGVMVILVLASFGGAMVSSHKIKHQRLLVCAISGAVYMVTLLGMTALFFGGQYSAVGVTALLVMCGVGLAALSGARQPGAGKRRINKPYHR